MLILAAFINAVAALISETVITRIFQGCGQNFITAVKKVFSARRTQVSGGLW